MNFKGIFFFIFFSTVLFAQEKDSLFVAADSTAILDSLKLQISDSASIKNKNQVEDIVYSESKDSLVFDVKNKKMFVYGSGALKYKQTNLNAGKIIVDYTINELEAFGRMDSSNTKLIETPVLKEGGDSYEGERIRYNFKTQQGFISEAKNKEIGSRYEGEKVKKVDKDTYFIDGGMFTTCDSDTPHTYFTADKMKVIQNDKIIADWIFMYIGGVPLPLPIPFAVFPNESGRRSGIIVPTYGQIADRGQYFRNFGYFWAASDYFDMAFTGDYYTKGGYAFRNRTRYTKRYSFSGNFNAGYSQIVTGESGDPNRRNQTDWNINLFHNQEINPTTRLDANLQFLSQTFLQNNAIDYNDLLSQDIISNATFNKRWEESGSSLTINYSRRQNLKTGDTRETLPNLSFSKSQFSPFKKDSKDYSSEPSWYELIALDYNGQFKNERIKTEGDVEKLAGVNHNVNLNFSPKLGYFNITPNFSYNEKWYNRRLVIESVPVLSTNPKTGATIVTDSVSEKYINEFNFVRTFDMSVSASTKLYGIMQTNFLGVEAFRHTIRPSISYTYQPDFASDSWNYYDSYKLSSGEVVNYDKYGREIFGGVSSGERQSLSFSLGNVFEIKTFKNPQDSTNDDNKITLLNVDASINYNFAADSLRVSDLNLSYRTQIGQLLSFQGSSSYTFYDYNGTQRVNRFLYKEGKGLFRLTNFNFSISTSIAGDKIEKKEKQDTTKTDELDAFRKKDFIALYDNSQPADLSIPWDLSLSYYYNLSKNSPSIVNKFSNLGLDLSFNLTENWKFKVRGSYDFEQKQISAPQITVYRDLHCWEFNFTWNPLGTYRGYHFEIRMKASESQDIKVTKARGLYSGRR
ncbi:MAG: LPS-assembly protein LptD [Melioribacteraceae bacterium]|nr:LPS-assembly protein LptD [Melioribacteraceae bacterium]